MPLEHSGSKAAVGHNISELRHSGYKEKQAVAIALENQRHYKGHTGHHPMPSHSPRHTDGQPHAVVHADHTKHHEPMSKHYSHGGK